MPRGPDRSGFTLELDIGFGITGISPSERGGDTKAGLSGLNLGLGGFLNDKTALSLRITSTSFTRTVDGVDVRFIAGFLGPSLQYWLSDQVFIGGGLGVGVLTTDEDDAQSDNGLGIDLRAGYNVFILASARLGASIAWCCASCSAKQAHGLARKAGLATTTVNGLRAPRSISATIGAPSSRRLDRSTPSAGRPTAGTRKPCTNQASSGAWTRKSRTPGEISSVRDGRVSPHSCAAWTTVSIAP